MIFGRRGFLHTLAAAAVGAATFDPKSLLWVPAAPATIIGVELGGSSAAEVIATQLELNELALRFARIMTDRLERHSSVALREVMFKHAGHVRLPGLLSVNAMGTGLFEPSPVRLMKTDSYGATASSSFIESSMHRLSAEMMSAINSRRLDMFAPVSTGLREGVPFSDDVMIGVGIDPESGLSARVLRFEQDSRGGRVQMKTAVELAAGRWTKEA